MSFDGSWNVTMNTPMGQQQAVLTLHVDGTSLTGHMDGAQGRMDLEDGRIEGETAHWAANMTQPMPIKLEFSATVDGQTIAGDVKLGAFGNASFQGTHAG